MKYLLTRKEIDETICEWEKSHDKGINKESLFMFIRNKQTIKILQDILEYGITPEVCKELLRKLNDKTE